MSVRVVRAAVAAGLLAAGFGPLAAPQAAVPACLTWTDPTSDSAVLDTTQLAPATNDATLDIVGAAIESTGGELTMAVKLADLPAAPTNRMQADRFSFRFVAAGKTVVFTTTRTSAGVVTTAWTVAGTAKTQKVTASYDLPSDTVVMTIPMADFTEGSGFAAGAVTRTFVAESRGYVSTPAGSLVPIWDTARAPMWHTHTIGGACVPAPATAPLGAPRAGCNITPDATGDGKLSVPNAPAAEHPDNDPDLDILGVVGETTDSDLRFYVRVNKLATGPARGNGHNFEVAFVAPGGKEVSIDASELPSAMYTGGVLTETPRVIVGGTVVTTVPSYAVFDRTASMVTFGLDQASLAAATGTPIVANDELTTVYAESRAVVGALFFPADEAPNTAAAGIVYKVGTNKCFSPPASKLTALAPVRVQYGDTATVSAKLVDEEAGTPLAGKAVRFAVGTDTATATTDAAGVARTTLKSTKTAGTYSMAVSFAGDSTADGVTAPASFTVLTEATKLTLAVAKSGAKRTVTATLKDDDGQALAGQRIVWKINGKQVATATTNSRGQAVLKTAKPTQTVLAEYAGLTGKYARSSRSARV